MKRVCSKYLLPGILCILGVCVLLSLLFFSGGPGYTMIEPSAEMQEMSAGITQETQVRLNDIAADLQSLAGDLRNYTPADPEAENILYRFYERYPNAVAVAWVDAKTGTSLTAPALSLTDILASPEIARLGESSFGRDSLLLIGPISSESQGMIPCFVTPVYDSNDEYTGFVLLPYVVSLLQQSIDVPHTGTANLWTDVWVINSKGTLISHPDTGAIGQNLYLGYFVDRHPELRDGLFYIIEHPAGSIMYRAYDLSGTQIVEKTGVWQTIVFGGQELRIVTEQYPIPEVAYPYVGNTTEDEQKQLVHAMRRYAKQEGTDKAVAEFNDPNGAFSGTGYNLFAYTMDGTTLVSAKSALIGAERLNYHDAYGLRPVDTMIIRADQGGGYVHYYRIVPYTVDQAAFTISYLLPVNEKWFVGASRAVSAVPQTYTISKREAVTRAAMTIHDWVTSYGEEAALAMLMEPGRGLPEGTEWILAVSYNGTLLADTTRPDTIGEDVFSLTDLHGTSIIRESVVMAKQGGGYMYLEKDTEGPDEGTIFLVYVEPVDDTWCILSATRLD